MDIKEVLKRWSNTDSYKRNLTKANTIIKEALISSNKPYIAFSGGKDSTVILDLVLKQKPDCMVFHWDYGKFIPRKIEKEIIENLVKIGAKSYIIKTSEKYKSKHANMVWYKDFFGKVIPELLSKGYDLVFVGLRKEESLKRKRRINAGKSITQIKECWPIADWTWKDVWAYIFSNNLPYVSIYDEYCSVLGWDKARLSTFFDPEFNKIGASNLDGVLMWKHRYI